MGHRATHAELSAWERTGYFVRRSVFSGPEVDRVRQAAERVHQRTVEAGSRTGAGVEWIDGKGYESVLGSAVKWEWDAGLCAIRSMEPFRHLDPDLEKLMEEPRLTAPMADLVKADPVGLFTDKFNPKRPGGAPFPWHQDGPYWAFGCDHVDRLASVGLYLCDTTQHGGCLWVFPGSHRQGPLPAPRSGGRLRRLYTDVSVLDVKPVPIEVPAGSLLFFHPNLVHGAAPNRSEGPRPALYITYQPAGFPTWTPA